MLALRKKKTHKAYLWAYCPGIFEGMKAVIYDFAQSRAGEHSRAFLQGDGEAWQGKLVCYDYVDYKTSFTQGIVEVGFHTLKERSGRVGRQPKAKLVTRKGKRKSQAPPLFVELTEFGLLLQPANNLHNTLKAHKYAMRSLQWFSRYSYQHVSRTK